MKYIEIFKTNVRRKTDAVQITKKLSETGYGYQVNFDLQDCDHILRIESHKEIKAESVIELLKAKHFTCEILY